jgi:hypothetical protein
MNNSYAVLVWIFLSRVFVCRGPSVLLPVYLLNLLLDAEDGGSAFLRKSINLHQTTLCHIPQDSRHVYYLLALGTMDFL